MAFSSLADELANAFDNEPERGGKSLANEFGLDLEFDEPLIGREEVEYQDETDGNLDDSPNPPSFPQTPPTYPSNPSLETNHNTIGVRIQRSSFDSSEASQEDLERIVGDIPPSDSLSPGTIIREYRSSQSDKHSQATGDQSVSSRQLKSGQVSSITRDPMDELKSCIECSSRLLDSLRNRSNPASLNTSNSRRSITGDNLAPTSSEQEIKIDIDERLRQWIIHLESRVKGHDLSNRELDEIRSKWADIEYGREMEVDMDDMLEFLGLEIKGAMPGISEGEENEKDEGELENSQDILETPHLEQDDPFFSLSTSKATIKSSSSHSKWSTYNPSKHIRPLITSTDNLITSLSTLQEHLQIQSSHNLSISRQIRQLKSSISAFKERELAEEEAFKNIEKWESRMVEEGLKGTRITAEVRLREEVGGFEEMLERHEKRIGEIMGNIRALRVS